MEKALSTTTVNEYESNSDKNTNELKDRHVNINVANNQDTSVTSEASKDIPEEQDSLNNIDFITQDDTSLIVKEKLLAEDLVNKMFVTEFTPEKRNGKMKNLKDEYFDFDIYQNNQCGFQTCRPFEWMKALESYVTKSNNTKCRWEYKKNAENKYEACNLILYFEMTKQVKIILSIKTGILMVKGQYYESFIRNEFAKIASEIATFPAVNIPMHNGEEKTNDVNDEAKREFIIELDVVGEDMLANKNAISAIDRRIETLLKNLQNTREKQEENSRKLQDMTASLEQKYDTKLVVFMAAYQEQSENRIKSVKNGFDAKIRRMEEVIAKFKISVQEQTNSYSTEKDEWKKMYGEWVLSTTKKDESETTENVIDELTKSIEFHGKQVEELKQECAKALKNLTDITTQLNATTGLRATASNKESTPKAPDQETRRDNRVSNQHDFISATRHERDETTRNQSAIDLLICMDSNRRHIDYRKLWTLKGSRRKPCGNLHELRETIKNETEITELKYILISVGVNDLDRKTGNQVFNQIKDTINDIRNKYEGIKIILSELTPRNDEKDSEVMICNRLITEWAKDISYIHLAKHSNLRDPEWSMFHDAKHVDRNAIPRFAANLKRALRSAYGIANTSYTRNHNHLPRVDAGVDERNKYWDFMKWKNQYNNFR